jgi:hypothetical protein
VTGMPPRRRGRPPNADDAELSQDDACIARTVWQLAAWGYPLRRRVTPMVAALAAEILGRVNANGQALSPARIEQIMEAWLPKAGFGWLVPGSGGQRSPGKPWTTYEQASLEQRRPRGLTLEQMARGLLSNQGTPVSTWSMPRHTGDPKQTAKRHQDWLSLRSRLRFSSPEIDETG